MKGSTISTLVAIAGLVLVTALFTGIGGIKPTMAALIITAIAGLGGYHMKRNGP